MDSAGASTSAVTAGVGDGGGAMDGPPPLIAGWIAGVSRRYQYYLDKSTPHVLRRWMAFGAIAAAYIVRIFVVQGFYLVSYALAIYVLSLVIAFLSPQADPAFEGLGGEGDDEAGPLLPVRKSDEFRPFVRQLPEFKFWYSITKAFCIAFVMTFFLVFDVPVFWPILFFYWLMLFVLTMKRQIKHMIKYRYVPFSFGKQQYGKKLVPVEDTTPAED